LSNLLIKEDFCRDY